jgi:hypothetical protein
MVAETVSAPGGPDRRAEWCPTWRDPNRGGERSAPSRRANGCCSLVLYPQRPSDATTRSARCLA